MGWWFCSMTHLGMGPSSQNEALDHCPPVGQLEPSFVECVFQRALISSKLFHQFQVLFVVNQSKIAGQSHQVSSVPSCVLDAPLIMSAGSNVLLPLIVQQTREEPIAPLRWSMRPRTFKSRSDRVKTHACLGTTATCPFPSKIHILRKGFTWPEPWTFSASSVALTESVSAAN